MIFFLPISAKLSTVFIILSLVAALPFTDWKNFIPDLKSNKFFLFSIAYFVMHLIGILYSDNYKYAFNDIQTKLSFLIFPILFTVFKPWPAHIDNMKKSFIAGCITALVICTVKSLLEYSSSHDTTVFFYTKFSGLMHPTYFGFYINLALLFLIDDAFINENSKKTSFQIEFFITELFLITGLFLLSARMSLIVAIFTLVAFIIIKTIQLKDKRKFTLALVVSFLIAGCIQFGLIKFYNRFTQIETAIQNEKQITNEIANNTAKTEEYNSTTSRLALWKYASELIGSSPQTFIFGVGTGDIKDELRKVYVKNNFQKGIDENYNPHNQFLHTAVVIGIIGMSLLLILLFAPLIRALKRNSLPLAIFLIIILLNGLTESILEVQSGIIFFCFFYCLMISEMNLKEQQNIDE